MLKFYDEELAVISDGQIRYNTIDYDPGKYKTVAGAAKGLYQALCKKAKAIGQNPDIEVRIWTPEENQAWGMGKCWRVAWEAGPYQWAINAEVDGPWGYAEPHYSFDLCFEAA